MMAKNIRMEWRQGSTGLGSAYVFNPKPNITRIDPASKQAELDIPLLDGVLVQDLGRNKRIISLSGILVVKSGLFEDLEDKRRALIDGIGRSEGQLHLISLNSHPNARHTFYVGQLSADGIRFSQQTSSVFLEYELDILCADPAEYLLTTTTITSDAKVV